VDESKAQRMAGWAGIAFSILSLIVIPFAVPPPPPLAGSPADVIAYWASGHRTPFLIGNYLGIAAFIPGFVQLAVYAARVRRLEGPHGFLSSLVVSSGTFTYTVFACSLVIFQVVPVLTAPDSSTQAFGVLANVWFALDGLAAVPLIVAVTWAASVTKASPRWMVPFGAVICALALLMSLGSFSGVPEWLAAGGPATALGFVAFFAWTFAWAVSMIRTRA
jgi:hypothetical protein